MSSEKSPGDKPLEEEPKYRPHCEKLVFTNSKTSTGKLAFRDPRNPQELFVPQWEVREDPVNIEAFVEYEYSFGRRTEVAFDITHGGDSSVASAQNGLVKRGVTTPEQIEEIQAEYRVLALKVRNISMSENNSEVQAFIDDIQAFRDKYAWMYQPKPVKKFVVKKSDS